MIFRLTDQFLLEGAPNVTCFHLLLRAGSAYVPLLGASSRWIFKVCETEVTAPSLGNFLQSLIALTGNFFTSVMLEFPWLHLWLFPHARCLCTCKKRLILSSLTLPTRVSRFTCVMCECDLILANLSSFWFSSSVWLAQLSLCWGLTEMCRRFMKWNILSHALSLTYFWKSLEKHWKYRWNTQFSPQKSSVIVVQLQRTSNMLNIL